MLLYICISLYNFIDDMLLIDTISLGNKATKKSTFNLIAKMRKKMVRGNMTCTKPHR